MYGAHRPDEVSEAEHSSADDPNNASGAERIDLLKQQKVTSVSRLLFLMALAVFVVESFVETIFFFVFDFPLLAHIFLDSAITVLLLFPLFYFLLYYPLHHHDLQRQESESKIRTLSRQLIRTTEEERHTLARDLHDDFGQRLTALQLGIEAIKLSVEKSLQDPEESKTKLTLCFAQAEKISRLISGLGDRVRAISSGLRPTMLDELGLVATLEWLVAEFSEQHEAIKLQLEIGEIDERFYPEIELTVFRVCQEALNNIAKHAKAEQVLIELQQVDSDLTVLIKDNGVGFDAVDLQLAQAGRRGTGKQGVGLLGMHERAVAMDGRMEIKSAKGQGSEVCLQLPTIRKQRKDNR